MDLVLTVLDNFKMILTMSFGLFWGQSMMLNKHDFELAIPAKDVGMKTGATIHTMNGLQMRVRTLDDEEPLPKLDGSWTKQHLKRGLNANGQPFASEEEALAESEQKFNMEVSIPNEISWDGDDKPEESGGGCPMHHAP